MQPSLAAGFATSSYGRKWLSGNGKPYISAWENNEERILVWAKTRIWWWARMWNTPLKPPSRYVGFTLLPDINWIYCAASYTLNLISRQSPREHHLRITPLVSKKLCLVSKNTTNSHIAKHSLKNSTSFQKEGVKEYLVASKLISIRWSRIRSESAVPSSLLNRKCFDSLRQDYRLWKGISWSREKSLIFMGFGKGLAWEKQKDFDFLQTRITLGTNFYVMQSMVRRKNQRMLQLIFGNHFVSC